MQILEIDPKWTQFSRGDWLSACVKPGRGLLDDRLRPLIAELISHFARITGLSGAPTHNERPVVLIHRDRIGPHNHPEHLIVYYPFAHPAHLIAGGERYQPQANEAIYLPPGTMHSVEMNPVKQFRISVAVRWRADPDG